MGPTVWCATGFSPRTIVVCYIHDSLGKILGAMGVEYHFTAYDSQIYVYFKIDEADAVAAKIDDVVSVIKRWMSQNFLCLNNDKTEVCGIGTKHSHSKLNIPELSIGD